MPNSKPAIDIPMYRDFHMMKHVRIATPSFAKVQRSPKHVLLGPRGTSRGIVFFGYYTQ